MWAEGAAAAETAAAEVPRAKGVPLQSRCTWFPWILSPVGARPCAGRLQVLLGLAFLLQLLPSTDHRLPSMLRCFGTNPELPPPKNFSPAVAFSTTKESKTQFTPETDGAFAKLGSGAASALKRSGSNSPILASSQAETGPLPAPFVDGSEQQRSDLFEEDHTYEEWPPASGQTMARAAKDFIYALNSFLNSAKREVSSSVTVGPTRSTTDGVPNSRLGWTFRDTEFEAPDARGANSVATNEVLAERPAWLLPEHRPSLLTRKYFAPRESGSCPAVGGFGHPLGREFDRLENWDELLCRSGGVLRKTNSPDLAYDTLVLVKGYHGGDAPLEESPVAADDDFSSSADSISIDSISGRRNEMSEPSFGTSDRSRSRRARGGTSDAQQKGSKRLQESISNNWGPRYRKTEAELDDELNEVVDLLSMLHCHLANVVDLRHPSNFQLYANIRQVALLRSNVLRQRKKATLQFPVQQGASVDATVEQHTRRHGGNTSRPRSNNNDAQNSFAEEGGVMRGHGMSSVSKLNGTTYSPQHEERNDTEQRTHVPHASTPRASRRGFFSASASYSPRRQEEKDAKLNAFSDAADTREFESPNSSLPLSALNEGGTAAAGETNEGGSTPEEEPDDDSGPVLVVVRNLSAPERLFFGAREIREFLLGRLLQTAYEIQAYNEFKRSLFALARKKRSIRMTGKKSVVDAKPSPLNRASSLRGPSSTQVRNTSAFGAAAIAAASQEGDVPGEEQGTPGEDEIATLKLMEESATYGRRKRALLTRKFSVTDWLRRENTIAQEDTRAGEPVAVGVGHDASRAQPKERISTGTDGVAQTAETPWHSLPLQPGERELYAAEKQEQPWWAPLGLRFDLYVSFAGVTPDRIMVSPTASLLRLVSEPRMRTLVCVYNYDDPKTDIPPVLRANGFVGLPALVLGRRVTTGARSIERLLISIVEYKPSVSYSLEQYAPRFLVREPIFSEVLATATVTTKPVTYPREARVR